MTFLKEKPKKENIEKALTFNYEPDKFKIDDKNVFIYCAGKYHKSKLTNNFFEKQLKVGATTSNINIESIPEKVWDVLTNPENIKKYLFGTEVLTDWNIGSPIVFQGEYDGQQYKDKGNVIEKKK